MWLLVPVASEADQTQTAIAVKVIILSAPSEKDTSQREKGEAGRWNSDLRPVGATCCPAQVLRHLK